MDEARDSATCRRLLIVIRIEPFGNFRRHRDALDLVIFDQPEHVRPDAEMREVSRPCIEFRGAGGNGFPLHLIFADESLRLAPIVVQLIVNHFRAPVADRFSTESRLPHNRQNVFD